MTRDFKVKYGVTGANTASFPDYQAQRDGTVETPAYTFTNRLNTGLIRNTSTGAIQVVIEGTTALTVLKTGIQANIDASQVNSGIFAVARIPDLNANKITSGILAVERIPDLNANKITTGLLPVTRGGTGAGTAEDARANLGVPALNHVHDASHITTGELSAARVGNLPASKITSGSFASARLTGSYTNFINVTGSGVGTFDRYYSGNGDITAPAYSFASNMLTGASLVNNNYVISVNGVNRLTVTSTGFGIGKVPDTDLDVNGTASIGLPSGTTEQRPASPRDGMFRFNTTTGGFEGYASALGGWSAITLAGTSVDANFLESQPGSFYRNASNLNSGNLPGARFNDSSHGSRSGGNLHANATSTVAGFMSAADKATLDLLPAADTIYIYRGILAADVNLNTVTLNGSYGCDHSSTSNNYPGNFSGVLTVFSYGSTTIQTFYRGSTNVSYTRVGSGSTWTSWSLVYNESTLPPVNQTQAEGGTDVGNYSWSPLRVRQAINRFASMNQTDAYLLSRSNHTGTQPISSVAGLQAALDSKVGTVTSVGISVPTGFTSTNYITSSGDIVITYASGYRGFTNAEGTKLARIGNGNANQILDGTGVNTPSIPNAAFLETYKNLPTMSGAANLNMFVYVSDGANNAGLKAVKDIPVPSHVHTVADTSGLQSLLNAKAPLASPTFTGTVNVSGSIVASGDITAFSDEAFKTDIERIDNALDIVDRLEGIYFTMNNKRSIGVSANRTKEALPEVVVPIEGTDYLSVAYGNLTAVLIEAVKELRGEVNHLKSEINFLKTQIYSKGE